MNVNFRKPLVATAIVGGILALSGTAAFAYWTATGTGSGTATTAAASLDLTVTQTAFAGSSLVPGGTPQSVSGTIGNTNTFAVPVSSLAATVAVDSAHAASGCLASWYSVTNLSAATTPVPANGNVAFSGKIQLVDQTTTNQDACKGATITLSYSAN
jgi:hypothetical protein